MTEVGLLEFGDWLAQQLEERDWSQGELARRTGYKRGVVSNWVRNVNVPNPHSRAAIARALELPLEEVEIAAGYDPEGADARSFSPEEVQRMMSEIRPVAQQLYDILEKYDVREVQPVQVPIVGYIPADRLRWASQEQLDTIDVTPAEIDGANEPFAVVVTGNCLRAIGILEGDTVILDIPAGREPRSGDLVAVEIDGEVTLKRWCETEEGVELRDGDDNIVHLISGREEVRIQGFYVTYRPTGKR